MFNELKWLSFNTICIYYTNIMIFKSLNNQTPTYIKGLLTFSNNSIYNIRSTVKKSIVNLFNYNVSLYELPSENTVFIVISIIIIILPLLPLALPLALQPPPPPPIIIIIIILIITILIILY